MTRVMVCSLFRSKSATAPNPRYSDFKSAVEGLSQEAQARINRLAVAQGFVCTWWDNRRAQENLAQAFSPTKTGVHTRQSYTAGEDSSMLRSIHASLDAKGYPAFPEVTKDERRLQTLLRLQITGAKRLKRTTQVRKLGYIEFRRLRRLHRLSKGADSLELFTGLRTN